MPIVVTSSTLAASTKQREKGMSKSTTLISEEACTTIFDRIWKMSERRGEMTFVMLTRSLVHTKTKFLM